MSLPHFYGEGKASGILLVKEGREHAQGPKDVYSRI